MAPSKIGTKSTRSIPDGKTSVTLNVDSGLLEKVKDIAWGKNVSRSEIFNEALQAYIKSQGKIKPRPKGKE